MIIIRAVDFLYMPDTMIEEARNVSVNLHGEHGRYFMFSDIVLHQYSWNAHQFLANQNVLLFSSSQFSSKPTNPQWIQKRMWWNNFYFARFVMIQLFFAAKWILVSEVTFESGEIFGTPSPLEISFQCG